MLGCTYGRLAQLVRAPALQAGGRRFESRTAHHVTPLFSAPFFSPIAEDGNVKKPSENWPYPASTVKEVALCSFACRSSLEGTLHTRPQGGPPRGESVTPPP